MNSAGLTHTEIAVNNTGMTSLSECGGQAGAVMKIITNKSKGSDK